MIILTLVTSIYGRSEATIRPWLLNCSLGSHQAHYLWNVTKWTENWKITLYDVTNGRSIPVQKFYSVNLCYTSFLHFNWLAPDMPGLYFENFESGLGLASPDLKFVSFTSTHALPFNGAVSVVRMEKVYRILSISVTRWLNQELSNIFTKNCPIFLQK